MILLIPLRKLQDSLIPIFKFHYDSINSNKNLSNRSVLTDLNSIMILLILAELYNVNFIMKQKKHNTKTTTKKNQKTSLFCRPLQNSTFLSCPQSYISATPPILGVSAFCRSPIFFALSGVDRNP